jgi:hypothetical protein
MQKKLIVLALAAVTSGAAFAQSNVSIYGTVDMGYLYREGKGRSSHALQSNSAQSSIGFKGVEDLGNGLKALFDLEYRITPIKAMAQELKSRGTRVELHYSGRTAAEMAYRDRLAVEFPGRLHLYFTRIAGATRIDLHSVLRSATAAAIFYVCGPAPLIAAAKAAARELAIPAERIQYESFE